MRPIFPAIIKSRLSSHPLVHLKTMKLMGLNQFFHHGATMNKKFQREKLQNIPISVHTHIAFQLIPHKPQN